MVIFFSNGQDYADLKAKGMASLVRAMEKSGTSKQEGPATGNPPQINEDLDRIVVTYFLLSTWSHERKNHKKPKSPWLFYVVKYTKPWSNDV